MEELWSKAQTRQAILDRSGTKFNSAIDPDLAMKDAETRLQSGGGLFGKGGLSFGGLENIVAQGFSLIATIPTAMTAAITKLKGSPDLIKQGTYIGVFGIIGSIIGANTAFLLSQNILNTIFAIFLLLVSVNLYLKKD